MERDRSGAAALAAGATRPRIKAPAPAWAWAWRATWTSRLLVLAASAVAIAVWDRSGRVADFDPAGLTGGLGAPFAAWDSVWFLSVADHGYAGDAQAAFFPLYPLLVRGGGWVLGSPLLAGVVISCAAMLAALAALHELTRIELGDEAARWTVVGLALSPMSFFLSAVYSEAVFLAVSVGCVLAARRERWWLAGLLGALGAATRSAGVLLVVPMALLMLSARPARARDWLALAVVPCGLGAFLGGLALTGHDWTAPFHAQEVWFRAFAGPFGGVPDGAVAAWEGVRQLLYGHRDMAYFTKAGGDPLYVARVNLMLFAFLLAAVPMLWGAARRLPPAYAAYALAALALPLSYPVAPQPLMSLPRFELVLFPLWMWWGWWLARHPRGRLPALAASAALLAVFSAQFATFHWVA
ncbi:MAG TPA: mannosyltransferase family protein [Casimicrobiaceae bacterium]